MANRFGDLVVTAVKAKGLPSVQAIGAQDPYVKMKLDTQEGEKGYQRTATHEDGGVNPEWNHEFKLKTLEGNERHVSIQIWDEEVLKDQRICWLDLDINEACEQGLGDKPAKWYTCNRKSGVPGDLNGGDLLLHMKFTPGPNDPATKRRLQAEAEAEQKAEEERQKQAAMEAKAKEEEIRRLKREEERKQKEEVARKQREEAALKREEERKQKEEAARKQREEAAAALAAVQAAAQAERSRAEEAAREAKEELRKLREETERAKAEEQKARAALVAEVKGIPDVVTVGLCSNGMKFINMGESHAIGSSSQLGPWERLQVHPSSNNRIGFKGSFGRFLSSRGGKLSSAEVLGEEEKFEVEQLGDKPNGLVAFKASNGKYLSETDDGVAFTADSVGRSERWWMVAVLPEMISLKTVHNTFLGAQPTGHMHADKEHASQWEKFRVKQFNRHGVSLQACAGAGNFVSAQPNGAIAAYRGESGHWEWFAMNYVGGNRLCLYGAHSKYVAVTDDQQPHCNASSMSSSCMFEFQKA